MTLDQEHTRRKELADALLAIEQDIRYKRFGPMASDAYRGETLIQAIRNRLRALGVNVDEASQVKPMFRFSPVQGRQVIAQAARHGHLKRKKLKGKQQVPPGRSLEEGKK